jgi:hypothetical protein
MYYKEIKEAKPVAEENLQELQETVSLILERVKKGGTITFASITRKNTDISSLHLS